MIFRFKEYKGATATEVVEQMKRDDADFARVAPDGGTMREFIEWSLKKLGNRLPPRELDLSPRVSDEVQAHSYLSILHRYGIGEIIA